MTGAAIEELVQRVEAIPDPPSRKAAFELVRAIMDLHASGLERALEILWAREDGRRAIDALGQDPTVSGLLVLHNLHPLDLEARVRRALDRPEFHAANVELSSISQGVVRVRITAPGVRAAVEAAMADAAPDAAGIEILESDVPTGFVPLAALTASRC